MIQPINILIARLKQAPRMGMPKKDRTVYTSDAATTQTKLSAEMTNLTNAISTANFNLDDYAKVVNKLNTENLSLQKGISVLTKDFEDYAGAMVNVVKSSTYLEQRNAELNTSFGITSQTAAKLGEAYDVMGENINIAGSQLRKYAQEINKTLPGMSAMLAGTAQANNFNKEFSKSLLASSNLLREHTGLTEEQAQKYELYAASQGRSALENMTATKAWADEFEKSTGMVGVYTMALEEISNLSEDVAMTYKKYPGMLEKSVVKAKMLGTSFEKIEAMASNMLNIEQSVGQELEYQLLSGKRLVNQQGESITENLRIAKLSGNSADAVKAMNDLLTSQGDILDGNNHYAKEQLAQLTGYTVQEMTRMKQQRMMLNKAGMTDDDINAIMSLDSDQFEQKLAELKADPKKAETVALLTELKETTTKQTTDQLLGEMLTLQRDKGITVMLAGQKQTDLIAGARTDVLGKGDQFGKGGAVPDISTWGQQFNTGETARLIGQLQQEGALLGAAKEPLKNFAEKLPIVNTGISKLNTSLDNLIKTITGTATMGQGDASMPSEKITGTVPAGGGPIKNDALYVNDGLIKFHPADKFAAIPQGAALLASTSTGALEGSVDKIMGNKSNVAVVDPAPIANAIIAALASMKVNVNYDVGKAAEAATFKINQGING